MLEKHILTPEETAEVERMFLKLYANGNCRGALKFYSSLNRPAKSYVDNRFCFELLNARSDSKRGGKK